MDRIQGRSLPFLLVFIILSLVLMLLLVTASMVARSRQAAATAPLSQSQIIQKATQYVQGSLPGSITAVKATQTTLGLVNPGSCSFAGRLVSAFTYRVRLDPYDLCNPATRVWLVELHGVFHWSNRTTGFIQIVLDDQGNYIRMDSGSLGP